MGRHRTRGARSNPADRPGGVAEPAARDDQLGAGGILTDVASAEQTAAAIGELLRDHDRRTRFGLIMQQRVQRYYDLGIVDEAYATIYRHHMAAQAQGVA